MEGQVAQAVAVEVLVHRVVSPLDTGSIHGRGEGILRRDHSVGVTFLLEQSDFVTLRERILSGEGDIGFTVSMNDVTAISTPRSA